MSQPRLYPVACESKDFALTGYADTIICEPGIGNNDSTLIGIRLGGEPAATQALATVLRTGVPFRITVDGNEFTCQGDKHKYSLQYSNLCGARRFPSEKDARESFQQLPAKAQSHHRIERVQPLHLLYFPPYQETA